MLPLSNAFQLGILFALLALGAPPLFGATGSLEYGYSQMYNIDFQGAHNTFQTFMRQHPQDPLGPVSDAAAYLFSEFERLGILDLELFADDERFLNRKAPSPDPQMRLLFNERTDRADLLANQALKRDPRDAQAYYAQALLWGLRSDYAGLIDKANLAALKWTKLASGYAREALKIHPDLYDAHLATGIENYMLSLKPLPVRWIAGLAGFGTDKARGIEELKIVAEHGHFLAPFARLMLAVADLREGNKHQAKELLAGLSQEFPQNTLYSRQMRRIGD